MSAIVLSTLNARYAHASLGLRYLRANLGEHHEDSRILEFTIKRDPREIVAEIARENPRLVGFGVYIWNVNQTIEVVRELREAMPHVVIVVGGPEISYETQSQELFSLVDVVFQGEADFTFRDFVCEWMKTGALPASKIIGPKLPDIKKINLPYGEYTDEDIRQRTLYVEASRGCPYKCEYCLSSLDVSVRGFDLDHFLSELGVMIARGARQFKFVDRTFNLAPTVSAKILNYFLERVDLGLFLHFEMVPDRLGDELKSIIARFPKGALQFEIGIQTWNPEVGKNVSRRQNYEKIRENFKFLREHTGVHTHADLIVGLPGETFTSFAAGFNALYELDPDEIQVGMLKRLKGTPITRHDFSFQMHYASHSPFEIISNKDLTAEEMARLKVFAEFWDMLANSGRFPGLKSLVGDDPFQFFFEMAQSLFAHFGRTHSIHLDDLERAVSEYLSLRSLPLEAGFCRRKPRAEVAGSNLPKRQALHGSHP